MSLVNGVMALGAAAFVVPLAIHLLFRSRFRRLDWGAMFLLQDIVNANRRRMQWHQWILLLLRCAIPILLAFAMARPLLSSIGPLGGEAIAGESPVSLILLVDESRSMSAGARSAHAIESINELLDSMPRRDEVILISSSRLSAPPSRGGPRDARETLRELRFDGAPFDMAAALQAGVNACRDATHPYRRIIVVSDFQENAFANPDETAGSSFLASLEPIQDRLSGFQPRPQLDFLDVTDTNADASSLANVVVESVQIDATAILVDRPVSISATVRNDSDLPVVNVRAGWMIDGRVFDTETISLEPRGTVHLSWQTTFDAAGGASVGLTLEHADAIPADNRRELAVEVLSPIRVWLVDGQPSQEPLQGETDFLRIALSPYAFRASGRLANATSANGAHPTEPRDLVSTKVMSQRGLIKQLAPLVADDPARGRSSEAAEGPLPDLIVLANVERPPRAEDQDPLSRYLSAGGHVLFFDGDQVDPAAWADCEWLPAQIQSTIESQDSPFRIVPPGARLSVWQSLGDADESLFDPVEISQLRSLSPEPSSSSVWLRTESGEPLVVTGADQLRAATAPGDQTEEGNRDQGGLGRVMQFAIACDTSWSNLPLRPVYLPMMQELVLEMVGKDFPSSQLPGTPMVIPPISPPGDQDAAAWRVTASGGALQNLPVSSGSPLVFHETSIVGAYRFGNVSDLATDGDSVPQAVAVRVVDVPASESTLRSVAPELMEECIERLGADRYREAGSLVEATQRDRFGRELWRPLLCLLIAVMIGEVLWQQRGVLRAANPFTRPRPEAM
ncbi:BatA domain-containing protein [Allorhodopirellula solitaria]|uniref:Aerotolerance regulator N-terminal domain-containing protein n=1 Tax=Allorhodopirellula solitaria TaxID=2527987 RepID=A0A5C5XX74_9BACT|nr:BatA domain-containing protein [Allorhodopirellula solitaria]TWT67298.1 hypothetical protein CA85_21480 [Allorhodopirellula solitaria]